jgi:hypothetical protein
MTALVSKFAAAVARHARIRTAAGAAGCEILTRCLEIRPYLELLPQAQERSNRPASDPNQPIYGAS